MGPIAVVFGSLVSLSAETAAPQLVEEKKSKIKTHQMRFNAGFQVKKGKSCIK